MAYSPGFCTTKAKLGLGTVIWRSKFRCKFQSRGIIKYKRIMKGILNNIYQAQHKDNLYIEAVNK